MQVYIGDIEDIEPCPNTYNGIFVEDGVDEREEMRKYLANRFQHADYYRIEIMTTQKCNLARSYCYQMLPSFQPKDMSPRIIDETITFINSLPLPSMVSLGENVLFLSELKQYLKRFKETCHLSVVIIINGYYLDEESLKVLLQFPIKGMQITLDGDRKYHNPKSLKMEIMNNY